MMKNRITLIAIPVALLAIGAVAVRFMGPTRTMASSHREAPITALDPTADITDVWAFRSYDAYGHDTKTPSVTMIMAVNPFEEPANGPNWFPFDPRILYEIHVDNDQDGRDDVVFQFASPRSISCQLFHGPGGIHLCFGRHRSRRSSPNHGLQQSRPESAPDLHGHDDQSRGGHSHHE